MFDSPLDVPKPTCTIVEHSPNALLELPGRECSRISDSILPTVCRIMGIPPAGHDPRACPEPAFVVAYDSNWKIVVCLEYVSPAVVQ